MAAVSPGTGGDDLLIVATIRRPHGVRGELALALETDRPRAVFARGRVLLLGDTAGRPTGGSLTVERARQVPSGMLLKSAEFSSRTPELEALRGRSLLIRAEDAAPAGANELHYRELLGMQIIVDDQRLGTVREITRTAAGELLVVRDDAGTERLIPYVREWIRGVDLTARSLVLEPPEGLLEV